ncbi:hypothetical protein [Mucilaginibacter jinjuensis]|uniref:Uncharacterized protein n=1 Tax=Mucilaginibacter jinjuensis TaxID=1176721 RepID=A0ABY7T969_9SPHI|nr:hypothetical protein [Mucilaginibacter jinjuensis]WCT12441.1 hypothetical protein PQO05_00660 [Mucilaginibacter jinjuensis]
MIFGIFAGLLAIGTAYTQWADQKDSDIKNRDYQDSIKTANREISDGNKRIIELQKEALKTADTTEKKTAELAELYKKNAALQEELKNQVTGGDSKPQLIITTYKYNNQENVILFDVGVIGKYALHDVKIKITDSWGKYMAPTIKVMRGIGTAGTWYYNPPKTELFDNWDSNKVFELGSVQPNYPLPVYETVFNGIFSQGKLITANGFNAQIEWNNGVIMYGFKTDIINGGTVIKSFQVLKDGHVIDPGNYIQFKKN